MKVALGWLWRGGVLGIIAFVIFGPLANLVLWAVAIQWYFPHKLPLTYGFRYWGEVFKPTSDAFARHQRPDRRNHRARLPAARHSGRLCARPTIFAGARLDSVAYPVASGVPECCRLSQHRPAVLHGRAQRHDRRGGARTRRAWTRDRGMDRRGGFCRGRCRARARRPQHGSLGAAHHAHDNVAIGNVIVSVVRSAEAPMLRAASSSSTSTAAKAAAAIHTAITSPCTACTSTTPAIVPLSPTM